MPLTLLSVVLFAHGAVHVFGALRMLGYRTMNAPRGAVRPLRLLLWTVAALALLASALFALRSSERWWIPCVVGLLASQVAIFTEWADARFGTIINLALAVPVAFALIDFRESSLPSLYRSQSRGVLDCSIEPTVVEEDDLMRVPPLVRWYLRRVGVVGRPHVRNARARFHGWMRNGRGGRWMTIGAEQAERFEDPARIFSMRATGPFGVSFDALHTYEEGAAQMRVRVASVFSVVDAHGPEMNQSETVTLFDDMVMFAPASLLDAPIEWRTTGLLTVDGTFRSRGQSVTAELVFDERGDLVTFLSNDRFESADGMTYLQRRWATPMSDYRWFDGVRLPAHAEAVWSEPEGDLVYARFDLESLETNVGCPRRSATHFVNTESTW